MFVEFINDAVFNKNKHRLANDDLCLVHYNFINDNKALTLLDPDIKFKFGVNTSVLVVDTLVGIGSTHELVVEAEYDSTITDCRIEMYIREGSDIVTYLHDVRENLINRSI